MRNKTGILVALLMMTSVTNPSLAVGEEGNLLIFSVSGFEDKNQNNGGFQFPKSPILIPEVYLNANVLTFDEALEGTTVQLIDEDEFVVFSDFIEENQTSIVFPATLSGTYELQIVCGAITFYCYIEL